MKRWCVRRTEDSTSRSWLSRDPLSPAYHVHLDACTERLVLQSWTNRLRRFYTTRLWEPQWHEGLQPIDIEIKIERRSVCRSRKSLSWRQEGHYEALGGTLYLH